MEPFAIIYDGFMKKDENIGLFEIFDIWRRGHWQYLRREALKQAARDSCGTFLELVATRVMSQHVLLY